MKNIVKINLNLINGCNMFTIKSLFHHEFVHIKQMYKFKDKDIILNQKNMSDNIENIFNLTYDEFNLVSDILYLFSPTEIQARINQEYRLVKDMSNEELYKHDRDSDCGLIKTIIVLHSRYNLYMDVIFDTEMLNNYNLDYIKKDTFKYYYLLNIIGYYMHIQKLDKNDIKKSSIIKMMKNETVTDFDKSNTKDVLYKLNRFTKKYINQLSFVINKALDGKKYNEYMIDRKNGFDTTIEQYLNKK